MSVKIPMSADPPADLTENYVYHDNGIYAAKPGETVSDESLGISRLAGIPYQTLDSPDQMVWGESKWGEEAWPIPEDFPDYKNAVD